MPTPMNNYWFFTAPHEPVLIRRGDPLGFRLVADYFADLLVPDLSNRSVDARWLTLLSWGLANAVRGWRHYDDRDVAVLPGRDRQAARRLYEWIRPLELLWVARTLELTGDDARGRQLPGQRAVRRWFLDDRDGAEFGLTTDQRARYRQTGAYGGYRVALRRLPGLTVAGDGWRPAEVGEQLAALVDQKIPWQRPHFEKTKRRFSGAQNFWLNYWTDWDADTGADFFPEQSTSVRRLPKEEAKIVRQVLFGGGGDHGSTTEAQRENQERRARVAEILGSSAATTHEELCDALADELDDVPDDQRRRLALLPPLTRLADAGIKAMESLWSAMSDDLRMPVAELAQDDALQEALDELRQRALEFAKAADAVVAGVEAAERFARSIRAAKGQVELLSALVEHHQVCGGGMRWFVPDGGHLIRNAPANRGGRVAFYRFRLWSLARLAVQCGVIAQMPAGLSEQDDAEDVGGEDA